MLKPEEKDHIRATIEKKIDKARSEIKELEELTKPIAPENSIGRVSRMDAINNKSVNEAALAQTRQKLQKLEKALGNIDKPEFGSCYKCGEAIPMGRLVLMPESTLCTKCASK
ncbi:MAG: TraR/DksA C4-type zinc finger protein [Marinilabilia sp.]